MYMSGAITSLVCWQIANGVTGIVHHIAIVKTRKLVTSAPRAYLWPVGFRHSLADAMFYVRTSDKAVLGTWAPFTLLFFLFQSSHAYRTNISEVKSFLHNQSVWDARKPIF